MLKYRILISGGGTGGHIFPAISIADAIRKRYPDSEILFVGALGKMEMEKVPAAGYRIIGLWISGFQRKFSVSNVILPLKLLVSLLHAAIIILRFKPNVVVGVGGFASGPTLRMASLLGIPTVIQEQNSFPGKTNKILGRKAKVVCVAYDHMEKYFQQTSIVKTGNPIRSEISNPLVLSDEAFQFFNLDKSKKVLLVIGGSQGALSINNAIADGLKTLVANGLQIIWQTGKNGWARSIEAIHSQGYNENEGAIRIYDFINRMDLAYDCASVIVSRAGAIAIAELSSIGKPSILIPFPHAAENHQTRNAVALVEKQAVLMISNHEANEKLVSTILWIVNNFDESLKMADNLKKLSVNNSAELIVDEIFKHVRVI